LGENNYSSSSISKSFKHVSILITIRLYTEMKTTSIYTFNVFFIYGKK